MHLFGSPRFFSDRGVCSPCEGNCKTCYGPRQDQCASCINGSFLLNTSCRSTCPPSHYPEGTECLPCYQNCLTCKGMYAVLHLFFLFSFSFPMWWARCFRRGKECINQIFAMRQECERLLAKHKDVFGAFLGLEKHVVELIGRVYELCWDCIGLNC